VKQLKSSKSSRSSHKPTAGSEPEPTAKARENPSASGHFYPITDFEDLADRLTSAFANLMVKDYGFVLEGSERTLKPLSFEAILSHPQGAKNRPKAFLRFLVELTNDGDYPIHYLLRARGSLTKTGLMPDHRLSYLLREDGEIVCKLNPRDDQYETWDWPGVGYSLKLTCERFEAELTQIEPQQ
jgi:hypothetical protein